MKAKTPYTELSLWRHEHLFNIEFASYSLSHHSFPRHFHDYYVIELVTKGADRFYCNGNNYTATKDQLVLINPGEVHTGSTIDETGLRYLSFYPGKKELGLVAETLSIPLPADLYFEETLQNNTELPAKIKLLFASLNDNASITLQQQYFFDCMQELLLQKEKTSAGIDKKDPRIKLLIDFINTHFREEISLTQMAALVNLNPFHLTRLFKKTTGLTPYDHLLILRTEYARQLLGKGYKVQEAAREAGFYDSSHLNRSLRKIAGTSPKSFLSSKGQYRTSFYG